MKTNRQPLFATLALSSLLLGGCVYVDGPATTSSSNDVPKAVVEMPDESPIVVAQTDEPIQVEEENRGADVEKIITAAGGETKIEAQQAPAPAAPVAKPVAPAAPMPEKSVQVESTPEPATTPEPITSTESVAEAEPATALEPLAAADQAPVDPDQISTAAGGETGNGTSGPNAFLVLLSAVLLALLITSPFMFGEQIYRRFARASKARNIRNV